jgi:ankyrin repeat protein
MQQMESKSSFVPEEPRPVDAIFRHEGPGASRVIAAIVSGDVAALRLLLRQGASPDTFYYGRSAVTWATMQDQPEALEVLLDAGANPETPTISGRRPLEIALSLRCQRAVELLSAAIYRRNARHWKGAWDVGRRT